MELEGKLETIFVSANANGVTTHSSKGAMGIAPKHTVKMAVLEVDGMPDKYSLAVDENGVVLAFLKSDVDSTTATVFVPEVDRYKIYFSQAVAKVTGGELRFTENLYVASAPGMLILDVDKLILAIDKTAGKTLHLQLTYFGGTPKEFRPAPNAKLPMKKLKVMQLGKDTFGSWSEEGNTIFAHLAPVKGGYDIVDIVSEIAADESITA